MSAIVRFKVFLKFPLDFSSIFLQSESTLKMNLTLLYLILGQRHIYLIHLMKTVEQGYVKQNHFSFLIDKYNL
jgi:hypothetical protein